MAKRQGFYNNNNKPFVYQELDGGSSFAIGIDSADSNKVKLQASTTTNIAPFGTAQISIDPAANGNVTVDPNGTGDTVLASGDLTLSGSSKANINIPQTNATNTLGTVNMAGARFLCSDVATTSVYLGRLVGNSTSIAGGTRNVIIGNLANGAGGGITQSVFIGYEAGKASTLASSNNVGIGDRSLLAATSGGTNIAIGSNAASSITTGFFNTIIGTSAGIAYVGNEHNNIIIQNAGVAAENNTMRLGTSGSGNFQVSNTYIAGINGVNVGSVASVLTNSGDHLGTATITAGTGISVTPGANTITIAQTTAPAAATNFVAYLASSVTNATGDNTAYDIIMGSTVSNVGAAYNTGTGTFTAPNTGLYHFDASVTITNLIIGHTNAQILFQGSVNQYSSVIVNPYIVQNSGGNTNLSGSITIPMTAGDTMKLRITVSGSTKTVTVYGQALTGVYTYLTGYQVA